MSSNCDTVVPEDFFLLHVQHRDDGIKERYLAAAFQDYVWSHPLLKFCPGRNCKHIMKSVKPMAKRCICSNCKLVFW